MSDSSGVLFDENLKLWAKFYPDCSSIFEHPSKTGIVKEALIKPAASGVDNLCCKIAEGEVYFHSQGDPEKEAENWFSGLELGGITVLYVYGIGLGYYYEAAKKWLEEDPNRSIVFFEDEIEVLRLFLSTERCKRLLQDPQATLFYIKYNEIGSYTDVATANAMSRYKTSILKTYRKIKSGNYDLMRSTIDFISDMVNRNLMEHFNHGVAFYRNYFLNILSLPVNKFGNYLFDKFKGIPAIICGAGPSMSDNGAQLAELADRALIFAGGSGMNAVNALNILPHFGVGVDPNPDQFTRLVMNTAYEVPFFYRCRMNHEALEVVHGERLFLTGSSGYNISKWMENKLGIKAEDFPEGHNVLTFSVMIAQRMGVKTVICTGIDLAYSKGKSYSSGISNHPIHPYTEHFITKKVEDDLIHQKDIYGNGVMSLWKWISESLWYSQVALTNPGLKFINSTEGGIGFERIENVPLAEASKLYLQKEYDIAGRIHGEITSAGLPSECNDKHIRDIVSELGDSLEECSKICIELKAKLLKKANDPTQSATLDGEIEGLRQSLHEQEGYKAMLQGMEETLSKYQGLQLTLRDLRKHDLDDNQRLTLQATSEANMIQHLESTACFNAQIIRSLLQNLSGKTLSNPSHQSDNLIQIPSPSPGETYVFENGVYTLIDPELDVNFSEKGATYEREVLQYPSGKLKMETHYKGGRIHGPSRFFDENGNLLSEAWFVDGKREGKMRTYHLGGAFHSVRGYKDGKKEGAHSYFYADGLPRSIIPYSKDVLSGEVTLYHPGGILARKLTFIDGVREGHEQIRDSHGTLIIEATYLKGQPYGTAREWYPNGTLSKEIVYDADSKMLEKRVWNASGTPIKSVPEGDFFDQVNVETSNLTDVLSTMVKNMESIIPTLEMRNGLKHKSGVSAAKENVQNNIGAQLDLLKAEMEHLKELGRTLEVWQKEGGLTETKEALWKTPELRKGIEGELKKKGQAMNEEMEKIRKGIREMLEKLKG